MEDILSQHTFFPCVRWQSLFNGTGALRCPVKVTSVGVVPLERRDSDPITLVVLYLFVGEDKDHDIWLGFPVDTSRRHMNLVVNIC